MECTVLGSGCVKKKVLHVSSNGHHLYINGDETMKACISGFAHSIFGQGQYPRPVIGFWLNQISKVDADIYFVGEIS